MATWNSAIALAALLLLSPLAKPAVAQPAESGRGCGLIGELIRQVLVSEMAAWRGETPTLQVDALMDSSEPQFCGSTSQVVSSAFTAVLAQFGIGVRWRYGPAGSQIGCLHHDISACNPFPDPMGPRLTPADQAFMAASWNRLRGCVVAHMPSGTASDISYFRDSASWEFLDLACRPGRGGRSRIVAVRRRLRPPSSSVRA